MKKVITILLTIAMIMLVGCSTAEDPVPTPEPTVAPTPEPTPEPFDLDGYKASAMEFYNLIGTDFVGLVNVASYEAEVMKIKSGISGDTTLAQSAIEKGFENYVPDVDYDAENKKIDDIYKEIILIDYENDKEAQEIEQGIRSAYEGYCNFYNLATTPGTTLEVFKNNYATYGKMVTNALDNIKLFAEE